MAAKESKKEEAAKTEAPAPAEAAKSGGSKVLVMLLATMLVSMAVAGGGVWLLLGHHKSASAEVKLPDKAIYYEMTPAFTVTLTDPDNGTLRYMQASVSIMTRNPKVQDDLKSFDPEIRNNLNQLFSSYKPSDLMAAGGREQLEKKALQAVNDVLARETSHKNACESFLFTSFVVQ